MNKNSNKIVMVFGVFDGLHPGHKYFLSEAAKFGQIIAVVPEDREVKSMKGKFPTQSWDDRVAHLKSSGLVMDVVAADGNHGSFKVIEKYKPDIICLGYDQVELKKSLLKYGFDPGNIITIKAYHPEKYKSSLLNKNIPLVM